MRTPLVLCIAVLALFTMACKTSSRPLTETEVIGRCIGAEVGEHSCPVSRSMCESIRQVMRTEHDSAEACIDACSDSLRSYRLSHPGFSCPGTLSTGGRLCRRYCRSAY